MNINFPFGEIIFESCVEIRTFSLNGWKTAFVKILLKKASSREIREVFCIKKNVYVTTIACSRTPHEKEN